MQLTYSDNTLNTGDALAILILIYNEIEPIQKVVSKDFTSTISRNKFYKL